MTDDITLRIIALSGQVPLDAATRGLTRFQHAGFILQNSDCIYRRHGRFAGSDAERLQDINTLANASTPMPDLILAARGGYGAVRLLEHIDYAALCPRLKAHGTVLMGFSDLTALQLALLAQGGVVTIAGPMLNGGFGAPTPTPSTVAAFQQILTSPQLTLEVTSTHPYRTLVKGLLWGGNLSTLVNLIGTPYLPVIDGGILFVEDVGEPLYHIERMLLQLFNSGILTRQSALVLGQFTQIRADHYTADNDRLQNVVDYLRSRCSTPILTDLPFGHASETVALPIGTPATLHLHAQGYTLSSHGYPTLRAVPSGFWSGALSAPLEDAL